MNASETVELEYRYLRPYSDTNIKNREN